MAYPVGLLRYMKNYLFTTLGGITLQLMLTGCDQLIGPRDYNDCVLKTMKDINSELAASAITQACREKFPERRQADLYLPADALQKLTGHASMFYGKFGGNIYNRLVPK
jgi:hypothetical protein